MKKFVVAIGLVNVLIACKTTNRDTIETADSANKAIQDTALNRNGIVVDDQSTAFLVRAANACMAEMEIVTIAKSKAGQQVVKSYADMLHKDHNGLMNQIKSLAIGKNIVLPDSVSGDELLDIRSITNNDKKNFDDAFLQTMIKNHNRTIDMYQQAMQDARDPDVKSFADRSLPVLRAHLDSAKLLKDKF